MPNATRIFDIPKPVRIAAAAAVQVLDGEGDLSPAARDAAADALATLTHGLYRTVTPPNENPHHTHESAVALFASTLDMPGMRDAMLDFARRWDGVEQFTVCHRTACYLPA